MLDKLIKYFVYETKGYITKTQLVKFLYLADLYAVKWTGKQLTNLDWYYYNHGPWHEDIDRALEEMNGKALVLESQDGGAILLKPNHQEDNLELPLGLKLMLGNIRKEWAGLQRDKLEKLLEYVYNTAPMLEVKEHYQPEAKVRLNLLKEREKLMAELGV